MKLLALGLVLLMGGFSTGSAMASNTLLETVVLADTDAKGQDIERATPLTEEDCENMGRALDGITKATLTEKHFQLSGEEQAFYKGLGLEITARRVQYCIGEY